MFRTPPPPPSLPVEASERPDYADGFFFLVRQTDLVFGSDRHPPVAWRPGLTPWREEPAVAVLPSTTQGHRNSRRFFRIPPGELLLQVPRARESYLYWRYETLAPTEWGPKIGMVSHPVRIQVMDWVVGLYSGA
jgi:hypothetical protein